jgi:hypothetical protein
MQMKGMSKSFISKNVGRLFPFSSFRPAESYVKGYPLTKSVEQSAGEVLLRMTEKHPKQIALYSYSQNRQFSYE